MELNDSITDLNVEKEIMALLEIDGEILNLEHYVEGTWNIFDTFASIEVNNDDGSLNNII